MGLSQGRACREAIRLIREHGGKAVKFRPDGMTEAGTPDVLACVRGRFLALERKAAGERVEPIQEKRMQEWADAGAIVAVFDHPSEVVALLEAVTPCT